MKHAIKKNPYVTTGAVFIVILVVGRVLLGWGSLVTAFGLLLYCILAIAIKLDAIAQRMDAIAGQLDRLIETTARHTPPDQRVGPSPASIDTESTDDRYAGDAN
jgi:hypothetical protein